MKNKTSTIGIGMLKMTKIFYEAVDFIGLIGPYEVKIAQRRPRPLKPYWVSLVKGARLMVDRQMEELSKMHIYDIWITMAEF